MESSGLQRDPDPGIKNLRERYGAFEHPIDPAMYFHALWPAEQSHSRRGTGLKQQTSTTKFEDVCMPHLDAAYNLAFWLARDERNAEDIVQEACLRAYRFIDSYDGRSGRAWLLAIVRNTFYTWLEQSRIERSSIEFDEEALAAEGYDMGQLERDDSYSVEQYLERKDSQRWLNRALERLPAQFREVVVLRELEDMSYKEIASVTGMPIGTVMSRLSRARQLLLAHLKATEEV